MTALRIGTRGSPLALWQAGWVQHALRAAGHAVDLVPIETTGDLDRTTPLARMGQPAVFSKELDEALLDRRVDLAVHSLKDLPTALPDGTALAAVSPREDPRDALVGRGPLRWEEIPRGAVIGTSSLRRQAQILRARPDLRVADLRGNIGTRIEQLDQTPEWTAIVLATAGLVRLGLTDRIGERLPLSLILPAPGQAALAVTIRAGDGSIRARVRSAVNDTRTEIAVSAERTLLGTLEGGCHVPVAAHAIFEGEPPELILSARVLSLDGVTALEGSLKSSADSVQQATELGAGLARFLIARGADRILADASGSP